jgi:hypothetical protein
MAVQSPVTHKQIREVAYKKLEELQEKLDALMDAPRVTKKDIAQASVLLIEARSQLMLTVTP